jgi:hypothetical protein
MAQTTEEPKGAAREVSASTRVTIGGAPISYVALFAAALGIASIIPFSMMTTGKAISMDQMLIPLTGIVLGPVGGFVAGLVGGAIGLAIAPYAASNGILTPVTPALAAMAIGFLMQRNNRKWWGVLILAIALAIFNFKGIIINKVDPAYWLILSVIVAWITLIIAVTPFTKTISNWLRNANLGLVTVGLAFATFMGTSIAMIIMNGIGIWLHEVPNDIWPIFPPIVTGERLIITLVGTILGIAVIAGLRRLRLVRPTEGAWYEDES